MPDEDRRIQDTRTTTTRYEEGRRGPVSKATSVERTETPVLRSAGEVKEMISTLAEGYASPIPRSLAELEAIASVRMTWDRERKDLTDTLKEGESKVYRFGGDLELTMIRTRDGLAAELNGILLERNEERAFIAAIGSQNQDVLKLIPKTTEAIRTHLPHAHGPEADLERAEAAARQNEQAAEEAERARKEAEEQARHAEERAKDDAKVIDAIVMTGSMIVFAGRIGIGSRNEKEKEGKGREKTIVEKSIVDLG